MAMTYRGALKCGAKFEWVMEKARSNRSKCKHCQQPIGAEEYRFGWQGKWGSRMIYMCPGEEKSFTLWYHPECAKELSKNPRIQNMTEVPSDMWATYCESCPEPNNQKAMKEVSKKAMKTMKPKMMTMKTMKAKKVMKTMKRMPKTITRKMIQKVRTKRVSAASEQSVARKEPSKAIRGQRKTESTTVAVDSLHPDDFATMLDSCVFTNGSDKDRLKAQFSRMFDLQQALQRRDL